MKTVPVEASKSALKEQENVSLGAKKSGENKRCVKCTQLFIYMSVHFYSTILQPFVVGVTRRKKT